MTPRSIRRAQERAQQKQARKAAAAQQSQLSPAQLQANRANAQPSTGPSTEAGKAIASLNAVKTGLTGRTVLLPSDDAVRYQAHIASFFADHSPATDRERDLVQSMADTWWRLRRIPTLEAALYAKGQIDFAEAFSDYDPALHPDLIAAETYIRYEKQFRNLALQESRLFRRFQLESAELKALQQTRREQAETAPNQTPDKIGFVFSNPLEKPKPAFPSKPETAAQIPEPHAAAA